MTDFELKKPITSYTPEGLINIYIKHSTEKPKKNRHLDPTMDEAFQLGGTVYKFLKANKISNCNLHLPEGLSENQ